MSNRLGSANAARWMMVAAALGGSAWLGGCASEGGPEAADTGAVQSALELPTGGFEMTDEAAALGIDADLDAAGLLGEELPAFDATATSVTVRDSAGTPGAIEYRVAVEWGQLPADLAVTTPHDWSGSISVNRGAVVVERTLRFEPATDRLLPRTSARSVAFTSATLPHHDGIVLRVIDPTPAASEPLVLTYAAVSGAASGAVALTHIVATPGELVSAADGSRMVAIASDYDVSSCAHGFLEGRWVALAPNLGVFYGRVLGPRGDLYGYVRGIWGRRASGEQVFFGKYVGPLGHFLGLLAGHYGDGRFDGGWINLLGTQGRLGGAASEGAVDGDGHGAFLGAFAALGCAEPPAP